MANSRTGSFGERLNTWVQIIAILMAGCWGVYVFIYQEFLAPKSAPTSLTLEVSLRKAGKVHDDNGRFEAMELSVLARNTTEYPIALLPGIFVIHGIEFAPATESDQDTFDEKLESEPMIPYSGSYRNKHSVEKSRTEVSIGSPFSDTALKPGETIKRVFLIAVPSHEYDALQASVIVPRCREGTSSESCEEKNGKFKWRYDKERHSPISLWRHDEKWKPMEKDDYELRKIQRATSKVMLSLWE
uniref:Uncharacterized protein n=1 Tax=Candidatus Kentrum sp. TC TaxID=2126339 RepID=A0A450ZNE1_9GAMM|nr:MAG: hypothetical protein BECKTC1821D_GA0114238_101919 [Candidatus Kentron sp. TC]VFK55343.1 MAG: hypothetical protein BECKTC1821F_GA0114240_100678 [Candidatus Kentron sp. TC]